MQHMYNKERNKVFELEQELQWNKGRYLKKNYITKKQLLLDNIETVRKCKKEKISNRKIWEMFGCSEQTVKRILKQVGM